MLSQMTPDLLAKIEEWRRKSADGTITMDEQKEAILLLRQTRVTALTASKASKAKGGGKKGPAKSADQLLAELGI